MQACGTLARWERSERKPTGTYMAGCADFSMVVTAAPTYGALDSLVLLNPLGNSAARALECQRDRTFLTGKPERRRVMTTIARV